jgi:hypothetical protein
MKWTTGNSEYGREIHNHGRDAIDPARISAPLPDDTTAGGPIWVEVPFPIRLRVSNSTGTPVDMESVLDRLSPTNLYLRLATQLTEGAGLQAVVRLSVDPGVQAAPALAVWGSVVHVRLLEDGTYSTEVGFRRRWFLYAE